MLQLKGITKSYEVDGGRAPVVPALRGIDLAFRDSEFVSVLGPSGCGKTTLLNILGGLDRYSAGDLIINGRSTKQYGESDWDTYRNHSIGFVFQSYNLIPHQTVLSNVELALTLSGVSRAERRRRATEALERVGLGDQLHKKPNQMSGGQMQRVAIARALVNDPDILMADEPTGALDTATSVQIMEILKEISHDKLILMVTHNPDLAETYSDRIIRLVDGQVTDDTRPYTAEEAEADAETKREAALAASFKRKISKRDKDGSGKGKRSMSFTTALSLSFQNLLTKKGRTVLTSFAGSIGIIGIALILALSSGVTAYINTVQEDTLSTYPLTIQTQSQDYTALMGAMTQVEESAGLREEGKIYVDDSMGTMMSAMSATVSNNLPAFKEYLDAHMDELAPHLSDLQYTYDFDLQVFSADGKTQVSPTAIFEKMGAAFSGVTDLMEASAMGGMNVMSQMIDNQDLLDQQYDVIAGHWPTAPDEVVLVVSQNHQISKMSLYMLGLLDQDELEDIMNDLLTKGEYDTTPMDPYTYEDFLGLTFRLLNTSDFYRKTHLTYTVDGKTYPIWQDVRRDILGYDQAAYVHEHGIDLKISGIICPAPGATATSISTSIGYTKGLTDLILDMNAKSEIIAQQKETPEYNVLTGLKFERTTYTKETVGDLIRTIDDTTMQTLYAYMTEQVKAQFTEAPPVNAETFIGFAAIMNAEERAALVGSMLGIAAEVDPTGMAVSGLCAALGVENVIVTPQNLMTLLPILNTEQTMTLVGGLSAICGETAMQSIYTYMNEQLLTMSVNEDNFTQLLATMDDASFEELVDTLYELAPQRDATQASNLTLFGDAEAAKPASIHFYAVDFESKDFLVDFIDTYNASVEEKDQLKYSDMVGLLMSSVTTIINVISYVLIAFVSISLVVSSIMIGIITYISVLERTKEIGILRAIGASRRDVSLVFNAETLLVGFSAGLMGILISAGLCIPINAIVQGLSGIPTLRAFIPWQAAIILVVISMVLTLIAGLMPAGMAARRDPVVALRSE